MAHKKSSGTTKNTRDSNPKYLGVKLFDGQTAKAGSIIIRQRGNKFYPGKNVKQGRDHTLFATTNGKVKFSKIRKTKFNGQIKRVSLISISPK